MAILCFERQLREVIKYLMNCSFYTLKENLFRDIGDCQLRHCNLVEIVLLEKKINLIKQI
ncbi:hypothetical protein T4B_323 [Trichinella pseudospiralis]|uniref:Uncharacterized protein n=1 Tax=Trichinella pseudospiralis TaxID=6337 RepID=A0A0V1IF46_TRIPS|nr:hypothetical protein T4B_323 [Trichinella pseudospiralis]